MTTSQDQRRWIILAFVLVVAALTAGVWYNGYGQALDQLARRGQSDLALASDRLSTQLQGYQELGTLGRGDQMEIGTYIEQGVNHELSGNIIDLCPVGALNNKPYRFSARAWEMVSLPTIAPHDCIGSNLNAHVVQGRVKRVVPRFNDDVNESWIADRDRFSCEGIYADDRPHIPS